jgi:hypothetical protein
MLLLLLDLLKTGTNREAGSPSFSAGTTSGRKKLCNCTCLNGIMYTYASINTNNTVTNPPAIRGCATFSKALKFHLNLVENGKNFRRPTASNAAVV